MCVLRSVRNTERFGPSNPNPAAISMAGIVDLLLVDLERNMPRATFANGARASSTAPRVSRCKEDDFDRLGVESPTPTRIDRPMHSGDELGRKQYFDPTACEKEFKAAERQFQRAMEEYKESSGRMFPTWSEVLEVLRCLGYEKIA